MSFEVRYDGLFLCFRTCLSCGSGFVSGVDGAEVALSLTRFWHSAALESDTHPALNGTVYDTVVIVMYNLKFKIYLLTRMGLGGKIH